MGEIAVCRKGGEDLFAVGLGSCIGLALLDCSAAVVGLAHIVLPFCTERDGELGKYANLAVPELIARMQAVGAVQRRMEAVLVGGARMFSVGELDIGARNEVAVRSELDARRITVRAAATGGDRGRTIRVAAGSGAVTVKEAGGAVSTLFDGAASPEPVGARR